jgi:hypothetical protein
MKKLHVLLALVLVVGLHVKPAGAIPLGTLIDNNGTIQEADKLFSNFALSNVTVSDPSISTISPTDPRNIDVQGLTNGLGEHGIRLVGPFQATVTAVDFVADLRFFLEYDVTVTDPHFLIHDVRHSFSFSSNSSGSANLITQAGFPPNVNASAQSVVGFGSAGLVNENRVFLQDVSSQHMLEVFEVRGETIHPQGATILGSVTTSSIDLTFSQIPIPEPSTWLLLGTGIAGLVLWRRYQKT